MSAGAPPSSLLFLKPGSFGDIVHALPCAAALKRHWPDTRLTWLVDERWVDLLAGNSTIDALATFPRQRFRGLAGKLRSIPWARDLKRYHPDLVLDLQGLLRSALMAKLSGAREIVGLADAREGASWFYQKVTPVKPGEHSVLRYLRSLDTLGVPRPEHLEFPLPAGSRPAGVIPAAPFILLHPFARGAGKSLSEEHVLELCRSLQPSPVLIAGNGSFSAPLPENTSSLLNQTSIAELIWLIRSAAFVISVDSGPMHIAAAVGTGLISIHTWSDPRLVGPFNEHAWIWQGGSLRRQTLSPEQSLLPSQPLTSADLAHIAELARGQVAA